MKNLNSVNKNKGVSLIAAIAIMLIVAVLSVVLASMLGVTSRTSLDQLRSAQALALAQAGLNWYMMRLTGISDWTSENNLTDISLGAGTFDITVSNKTSTRVDFTLTGKVTGSDGVTIKHTMSQRAWKLPSASKFSLFWGRDVANLSFTNVSINGDFWSIGTTSIPSGSSVTNGNAFRPATEDITGTGSYTEVNVGLPFPSTPPITPTYYTNLINDYNAREAACASTTTINQNTNLTLTGNTICCRDFNTNGTITISGNGFIVANRDILLHTDNADSGTLTISPSGGNIVFIAGRNLTINSAQTDTSVTMNSGVRMYDKSDGVTTGLITIRNDTTNITGALILSARQIIVQSSAHINNSTLFLNDPGSATNNVLTITDAGTTVGTIASPCNLISISRGAPTLRILGTASVTGFIYQRDTGNLGRTNIAGSSSTSRVSITGSLIANAFTSNAISNANITYDPGAIPDPPPEGFNGFATKKPNTWSGN